MRSGAELSRAVGRLDEVRVLTLGLPTIDHVPPGRVTALARFATVAEAQAVARMPLERRMATLLALVRTLEATTQDDVLDLFDIAVTALFTEAAKVGKKTRLRTIRDLDAAALQLQPSTSWKSRPALSRSMAPSPRACHGWTCPNCCLRFTPERALPTGSPMPARAVPGPPASPPASVPCCSPKRATQGSNL